MSQVYEVVIDNEYSEFHYFVVAEEDREALLLAQEQHAKTSFANCPVKKNTLKVVDLATKGVLGSDMVIKPRG